MSLVCIRKLPETAAGLRELKAFPSTYEFGGGVEGEEEWRILKVSLEGFSVGKVSERFLILW